MDDVLGGADAWENVDSIEGSIDHSELFYPLLI